VTSQSAISFASYMQEALYGAAGYYMTQRTRFGRAGDFYTSAQVSPLFGALWALAVQEDLNGEAVFSLVELGCGEGGLADSLLRALCESPGLRGRAVRYAGIEVSAVGRARTHARLMSVQEEVGSRGVDFQFVLVPHVSALQSDAQINWQGAWLFGNEVLDALACDVIRVTTSDVHLLWVDKASSAPTDRTALRGPFSSSQRISYFEPAQSAAWTDVAMTMFAPVLQESEVDAVITEWVPGLPAFLNEVIRALQPCAVTFIDYGGYAMDVAGPDRPSGSVRGFREHKLVANILEAPGACDITYDVNFSEVQRLLSLCAYKSQPLRRQGAWLLGLPGIEGVLARAQADDPGSVRRALSLFMPGGMGDRFVVSTAYPMGKEERR